MRDSYWVCIWRDGEIVIIDEKPDLDLTPGSGRSLRAGMATHYSILAWEIPWTEEPGRLQSMGSQRVRHD